MRVPCDIDYGYIGNTRCVTATCGRCGHETESYGDGESSILRCLALLREECPEGESNFYVEDGSICDHPPRQTPRYAKKRSDPSYSGEDLVHHLIWEQLAWKVLSKSNMAEVIEGDRRYLRCPWCTDESFDDPPRSAYFGHTLNSKCQIQFKFHCNRCSDPHSLSPRTFDDLVDRTAMLYIEYFLERVNAEYALKGGV